MERGTPLDWTGEAGIPLRLSRVPLQKYRSRWRSDDLSQGRYGRRTAWIDQREQCRSHLSKSRSRPSREGNGEKGEGETIVIDPIDGTSNFIHGIPHVGIVIGKISNNEITDGIIYNPILNELYWSSIGKGAWCNNRRIRVSKRQDLTSCLIGTGIPFGEKVDQGFYKELENISKSTAGIRRLGAASLDLAYVASGKIDGFWEKNLNLWDVSAGVLLVKEAQSFTEEVRRIINTEYGFKKVYSEGLSISTPLNGKYQIAALNALRSGIESYDKRQGWRGPITNVYKDTNWQNKVNNLKIDKTLNWEIAQIISVEKYLTEIKILNKNLKGKIFFEGLKWTGKKNFNELLSDGDIIFVQKKSSDIWTLKQLPKVNGGIVVMDPFNGKVKALVGGYSFVSSEFNRATQAKRQPGSAFKPIVYAAALENGFLPNSLILDAPFVSKQGEGLKKWKPQNYGKKFYGPSTLRMGVEKSRNLMTVRVAQQLGFDKIAKISKDLGVYEDVPELLSVSLGSNETTLLKITNAYCSFVNGGKKINPNLITRIQDRRGKTIYNFDKRQCEGCEIVKLDQDFVPKIIDKNKQVISEETAYQMTSILEGVVERGTGKKLRTLKVPLAGKTGTTNKNFDAWFIGFTSNLAIGVYIGYDEPKSLGKFETGAKAALPIFKKFVETAIYKEEMKPFKIPESIYFFPVNYDTGEITTFAESNMITESFKQNNSEEIRSKNLSLGQGYDRFTKFKRFY